jgi:hypothetical protein
MFETFCCPEGVFPPVPEGWSDRSLARSAWDSATSKEPSRRVRSDSRRYAHRFDDWSDWPCLKNTARPFDERHLGLGLRPIIPCPTGRFFWGGAVPGTSCQATIGPSFQDWDLPSSIKLPRTYPEMAVALQGSSRWGAFPRVNPGLSSHGPLGRTRSPAARFLAQVFARC